MNSYQIMSQLDQFLELTRSACWTVILLGVACALVHYLFLKIELRKRMLASLAEGDAEIGYMIDKFQDVLERGIAGMQERGIVTQQDVDEEWGPITTELESEKAELENEQAELENEQAEPGKGET